MKSGDWKLEIVGAKKLENHKKNSKISNIAHHNCLSGDKEIRTWEPNGERRAV